MGPMLKWFVFTVGAGLLPFAFSAFMRTVYGRTGDGAYNSPELLFFALMVSAVALGEIHGNSGSRWRRQRFGVCFAILLFGVVTSAALYGVYVSHEQHSPGARVGVDCRIFSAGASGAKLAVGEELRLACGEWLDVQSALFLISIWVAVGAGVFTTCIEWHRARRRV